MKKLYTNTGFILVSLCALTLFCSCPNALSSIEGDTQKCSISGSLFLDGALPSNIPAFIPQSQNSTDRSAFPEVPSLEGEDYIITITAQNTNVASDKKSINTVDNPDCFSADRLSYTISDLKVNQNYVITASVKDLSNTEILMGKSKAFFLSNENSICVNADITLAPLSNGSGSIQLEVTIDKSKIKSVSYQIITNTANWPYEITKIENIDESHAATFKLIDVNNIPSGAYDVVMRFYSNTNGAGALLYQTRQTVNVFDGLITNQWVNNASEEVIDSDSKLNITSELIEDFNKITDFFVSASGNDDNSGTWLKPLETIGEALSRMIDDSVDYTITIQNNLTGTYILEASSVRANSIAIRGEGSVSINGNNATAPVLKINMPSNVPVTIENLTITGGKANYGAGLYIEGESNVTLGKGAVLSGNKSSASGAGVYVIGTSATKYPTLTILSGAKITDNHDSGSGCGVCILDYAKVIMAGGELSNNTCNTANGGSVHLYSHGSFTMKGGTISGNSAARGAAVYVSSDCNFEMTGGIISENTANNGGAVYVASSGESHGEFHIGANALIPFGGGTGKNDICVESGSFVTVDDELDSGFIASLSCSDLKRGSALVNAEGDAVLTDIDSDIAEKFVLSVNSDEATKDDGWETLFSTDQKKLIVNAPIYVGTKGSATGNDSDNKGTKSSPFASIARAVQEMTDIDVDYIININGTVSGSQNISSSLGTTASSTYKAKSVLIQGATGTSTDSIDARVDGTATGPALSLETTVPVSFKNITITGGNNTSSVDGGGGLQILSGTVILGDGVKITGNTAQNGGGVYVTGAKLFMYGSALIGDSVTSKSRAVDGDAPSATTWANKASMYGGGIYCADEASVYMGYSGFNAQGQLVAADLDADYGIRRNYAAERGGGIYTASQGTEKTSCKSGTVAYNSSPVGGGVYISDGTSTVYASFELNGASVSNNYAATSGGGFFVNNNANCTFDSGTVSTNETSGNGGAIYSGGSVTLAKDAYIPSTGHKKNDIYLLTGKTLSVPTSFSHSMTINLVPQKLQKHLAVLSGSNLTSVLSTFSLVDATGFAIKDTGKIELKNIITTIYVSPTGVDPSGNTKDELTFNNTTLSYNENTSMSSKPFATVDMALKFITYQESYDQTYTICITGTTPTLTEEVKIMNNFDADSPIVLSSVVDGQTVLHAKKIILKGAGTTSATLNGTVSSDNKHRPLTINTPLPVELQYLNITGGSEENGGGLYVGSGSSVTLGYNTKVYGNEATLNGGGIYSKGTLIVKSNAIIGTDGNYTEPAQYGSTSHSNVAAENGGGIYISSGTVWFGYTEAAADKVDSSFTGKIIYNASNSVGGGVSVSSSGSFYMAKGQISFNSTSNSGGGIYVAASNIELTGGSINTNKASKGGGVYISGSLTLGSSSAADTVTFSGNTATSKSSGYACGGGACYVSGTLTVQGYFSMPGGSGNVNDIYLASRKLITTNGISSTGTLATVSLSNSNYLYLEYQTGGCTVMAKTTSLSSGDFINDTAKFALVDPEYFINKEGMLKKGFAARPDNIVAVLSSEEAQYYYAHEYVYTVSVTGTVDHEGLAAIASAINNAPYGPVSLDITQANFSGVNTATVFNNCTGLDELYFDASTFSLSSTTFDGCSALSSLIIYGNLSSMPNDLFKNCNITSIEYKNAEYAVMPGIEQFGTGNGKAINVLELPTTLRNLYVYSLSTATLFQYLNHVWYSGSSTDFKTKVTVSTKGTFGKFKVTFTSDNVDVYWAYNGGFIDDYDTWSSITAP